VNLNDDKFEEIIDKPLVSNEQMLHINGEFELNFHTSTMLPKH
jgi:hypothetical protein